MIKMIRYYEDWKATTECKKFIVYCDMRIEAIKQNNITELKSKRL